MNEKPLPKARTQTKARVLDRPGLLFILSAPSGAGKSTLCRAVRAHFTDLLYSVSYTTRAARPGEQNGVDYHFIDQEAFERGIARGRWAEWAAVHGNYYGTCADFLDRGIADGRDILLDIDVQGTRQLLKRYPAGITIFIMPPSLDTLKSRLQARGTDSAEVIAVRLKNAQDEMAQKNLYRHVLINDRLPEAVTELIGIFERYRR